MERGKRITTPYSTIYEERLREAVGIVMVMAHQSKNGFEILMEECKQTAKTEEGDFGLPSETGKVNIDTNMMEPKPSTLRRLGQQELGFDFKNIDLYFSPKNSYFETDFPITVKDDKRETIKKVNALAKVVIFQVRENDFLPEIIDNKEVKGARFESLDEMLHNPQNYQFRENTHRILSEVSNGQYLQNTNKLVKFRNLDRYPYYIYTDKHLREGDENLGKFIDVYVRKK